MKLTTEQRAVLLKALHSLATDGPVAAAMGICRNLHEMLENFSYGVDAYEFVAAVSVDWPGRTGQQTYLHDGAQMCCFPIAREYDEHDDSIPLWEGSQLEQRQSLMAFLTGYLEGLA
jgi:hypothetical protein